MPDAHSNISNAAEGLPARYPQPGTLRNLYLTGKTGLLQTGLTLLGVMALYYAASKATILWIEGIPQVTLLWLPAGVALASVLLCGYRILPAVFAGSLLENVETGHAVSVSTGIAFGHVISLFICVWFIRRFLDFDNDLRRLKDVLALCVPVIIGGLLHTAIGVTSVRLAGLQTNVPLDPLWWHWLIGNINGALFVTPIFLVFLNRKLRFPAAFWRESIPLMLGLGLLCTAIFGPLPPEESAGRFLIFPFVILAAYRFGQYGTTFTLFVTMAMATWWLVKDVSIAGIHAEDLPLQQIFMMTLAVTGLFLGAAISERQKFEQQLQQYTKALEHSNRELDDFTYIVSHDLKEPLRGLKSFSQFLLEDYEDKLDDEGKNKLRTISSMVSRLESLLETLLYFSRLGRTEMAVSETDIGGLVMNVIAMLSISLKEKNTTVEIEGRLPIIKCNSTRIQEVFQNLIGNAIKYNDKPGNKIEVGVVTTHPAKPGEMVFYVRDHGIGIQERYLETIFNIFKRLHPKNAYGGGTGSGLAIVRKIISQHGGEIWAESKGEGQGTTFYFTIPQ